MKNKFKVLVFGSGGMVGSSLVESLKESSKVSSVIASNRKDTDLFDFMMTKNTLSLKNI